MLTLPLSQAIPSVPSLLLRDDKTLSELASDSLPSLCGKNPKNSLRTPSCIIVFFWPAICTCTNVPKATAILAHVPKGPMLFLNLVNRVKQPRLPIQPLGSRILCGMSYFDLRRSAALKLSARPIHMKTRTAFPPTTYNFHDSPL
jgi:hypothetical protein